MDPCLTSHLFFPGALSFSQSLADSYPSLASDVLHSLVGIMEPFGQDRSLSCLRLLLPWLRILSLEAAADQIEKDVCALVKLSSFFLSADPAGDISLSLWGSVLARNYELWIPAILHHLSDTLSAMPSETRIQACCTIASSICQVNDQIAQVAVECALRKIIPFSPSQQTLKTYSSFEDVVSCVGLKRDKVSESSHFQLLIAMSCDLRGDFTWKNLPLLLHVAFVLFTPKGKHDLDGRILVANLVSSLQRQTPQSHVESHAKMSAFMSAYFPGYHPCRLGRNSFPVPADFPPPYLPKLIDLFSDSLAERHTHLCRMGRFDFILGYENAKGRRPLLEVNATLPEDCGVIPLVHRLYKVSLLDDTAAVGCGCA